MKSGLCAFAAALLLAGCLSPPPVYTDPFQGLLHQSSESVPVDAPATVQRPVGLILSDNVEALLQNAKRDEATFKSFGPLTNTVALADQDPKYIAGRLLPMLKSHYPDIELIQDFNEATAKKTVCLVDVKMVVGRGSFQKTTVDISIYVFDENRKPLTRIVGHGEGTVPFPATDMRIQPSVDAAIQQLSQKMSALLR